jgi:hypothetical protein
LNNKSNFCAFGVFFQATEISECYWYYKLCEKNLGASKIVGNFLQVCKYVLISMVSLGHIGCGRQGDEMKSKGAAFATSLTC